MTRLERGAEGLAGLGKWAGGLCLLAMVGTTCLDVVLRAAGRPVWGLVEAVSLLAVVVLAAALPLTQRRRGHVALDMVVRRLSPRAAAAVDVAGHLVACGLFALAAWQTGLYGLQLMRAGQVSQSLEVPLHLPVWAAAAGFAGLSLALLADARGAWRRAVERG
jgi:TRAP-type C4-dicarboxylate transport system permease small subunit